MVKRRSVLQAAMMAPLLSLIKLPFERYANASPAKGVSTIPLYKAIFDQRFPEGITFAGEMQRIGVETHGINGDVTGLWYDDLYQRWREEPAAIAGVTGHGALFCLEQLARDAGMRPVFLARHLPAIDRSFMHEILAPAGLLSMHTLHQSENWPHALATALSACPVGCPARNSRELTGGRGDTAHDGKGETLYSWLIAPVSRSTYRRT